MEKIIKELRKIYQDSDKHEMNIRYQVILKIFLEQYGYSTNPKRCILEKQVIKGYCDVWVSIDDKQALFIEVKHGEEKLKFQDIAQVKQYVTDRAQRYAILSNGYEFMLLDFNIKIEAKNEVSEQDIMLSYVVFKFNIFKPKGSGYNELKYFKYLSCENLFVKRLTCYFSDIAQYKQWKNSEGMRDISWIAYRSTLFQFYNYYSDINKVYTEWSYEKIDMDVFMDFICNCKRGGSGSSKKTIENNYTHIYDMLAEMKSHRVISYISLQDGRKSNLSTFPATKNRKSIAELDKNDINTIIQFYEGRIHGTRNITIFLFSISLGLERSQLINLKWRDFDKNLKTLKFSNRKIELCPSLQKYLKILFEERKENKIKSEYVFQTMYNGKFQPMSRYGLNEIFNTLCEISDDDKWKDYSPKHIRNCLFISLYNAGYSLEEVIYITGIDINNLSQYISSEMIIQNMKKKIDWKKLYNGILCEV